MSDDTHQEQETVPENNTPLSQDAGSPEQPAVVQDAGTLETLPVAQESFGSFPEQPEVTASPSAYDNPAFYNAEQSYLPPAYGSPQPPYGYGAPPSYGYGTPPPSGYEVPREGYYGQPSSVFQFAPQMPLATPLPIGIAIRQLPRQYWRVFTHPKATTFIEEEGKAAWNIIWVQLLFLGIIETIVVLFVCLLEFFLIQAFLPGSTGSIFSLAFPVLVIIGLGICFAFVILSFFFGAGIYYLVARAFGGEGSFLSHCYNYSLVIMPIAMVSIVVYIIPCLGSMAALAGLVYEVILLIFMVMGVHRLSGGKASATVLIPVVTGVLLVVGAYVAYFLIIFAMIPHN